MRLANARFSKDLDLLHLGEVSPNDAIAELRAATTPREGDHLTFVIEDRITYSRTNPIVELSVTAYIGAKYDSFPIDLAHEPHFLATPERIRPAPVVEIPGLAPLPEVIVYPLSDQIADKVCAMYELYGDRQSPSSRFRDLIDLVLIVTTSELDAMPIIRALHSERTRRQMQLPTRLVSPGPQWPAGYTAYARRTMLGRTLLQMDAALGTVGDCLNPLLDGTRTAGRWAPGHGWTE